MRTQSDNLASGSARGERREAVHFLCMAAKLLHRHGTPAHRLEDTLTAAGAALGVRLQVMATPTSVELAFGGRRQRTHLVRGEAGEAELGRLVALDRVIARVTAGELTPRQGRRRLRAVTEAPAAHGKLATVFAYALASGGAARFFSGNGAEILSSAALGLGLGLLAVAAGRRPGLGRLLAPLAAALVAGLSMILAAAIPGLRAEVTILAALIVLIPGLSLTLAMTELATRHLVSGTARLAGSLTVFVTMAFGVAVAREIVGRVDPAPILELAAVAPGLLAEPGEASRVFALLLAPVGFCVLFQARWVDAPAIAVTGIAAAELARHVGAGFGPELGAFVGAFVIGLGANAYAAWQRLPAAVVALPGLLLLVPGSIGFRSVTLLLGNDPSAGVEAAFRALLVAVALVAGVLAANVINLPKIRARPEQRVA